MSSAMWFFTVVVGPVLLLAAITWAVLRSRKVSRNQEVLTDAATRRLREDIKRDPHYREE